MSLPEPASQEQFARLDGKLDTVLSGMGDIRGDVKALTLHLDDKVAAFAADLSRLEKRIEEEVKDRKDAMTMEREQTQKDVSQVRKTLSKVGWTLFGGLVTAVCTLGVALIINH